MARTRSLLVFFVLGGAVAACSPAPAPVAHAANDPSNPDAPEGTPVLSSASSPTPHAHHEGASPLAAPHEGHADPADAPAMDTVYVCPMHPDVTSKEPGECPKCHMKLVPRK